LRYSGKPILVLYPGSSGNASFRRWRLENYFKVIREFQSRCKIIVAGGLDEMELKSQISLDGVELHEWFGRWSLIEWAWIFKNCADLFVGTDAGLLHVADMMELRTLSICGPNLYNKWGSLKEESEGLKIDLDCRPCIKPFLGEVPKKCHRGDFACLERISIEEVIETIGTQLMRVGFQKAPLIN